MENERRLHDTLHGLILWKKSGVLSSQFICVYLFNTFPIYIFRTIKIYYFKRNITITQGKYK